MDNPVGVTVRTDKEREDEAELEYSLTYRKTFEEKGITHGINNGTGEVKYALCDEHCTPIHHIDQHPHFQCEQCKQISCIESLVIPKMELPKGYLSKEITMMIKGVCPDCQE